jgi:hypothetical protein
MICTRHEVRCTISSPLSDKTSGLAPSEDFPGTPEDVHDGAKDKFGMMQGSLETFQKIKHSKIIGCRNEECRWTVLRACAVRCDYTYYHAHPM